MIEQIRREGGSGEKLLRTDIADEFEVKALLDAASVEFGRIDILYNNAAVLLYDHDARAHEVSLETWDRTMNVNLRGTFLCSQHPHSIHAEAAAGSIINVGSPTGLSRLFHPTSLRTAQAKQRFSASPG